MKLLITTLMLAPIAALAQNPLHIPDTVSGSVINLNLQTGTRQFYPGTATNTMGANGSLLGPTILLSKHQNVQINVNNQLPDTTTIHWHGLHVAPDDDGGPHTPIPPNTVWSPAFPVLDWAATYWYHPHLHHKTDLHVSKGISGFIIVRDSTEASLNLPRTYGVDDFPLAIQTKEFDANNQIVIGGRMDTSVMVNGTINPFLNVPAQYVRLRLLNGSSERTFELGFTNNKQFYQIASDGGLLTSPVPLTRLRLSNGERAEIVVDLTGMNGQTLDLMNYGSEMPNGIYGAALPGMGMGQSIPGYNQNPLNGSNFTILKLNVVAPTANPISTIPTALTTHSIWNATAANLTRTFTLTMTNPGPTGIQGPFEINNTPFDMMHINFTVPFNNIEIWEIRNQTPIAHPFHIHGVPFYVLSIGGATPAAHLQGRKDVILVPGGNTIVRFITRFENYHDPMIPYMYHCHMLPHEEDGMMGQFLVGPPPANVQGLTYKNEISVFPIPATERLKIKLPLAGNYEVKISNNLGQIAKTARMDQSLELDIAALPTGLYFVEVTSPSFSGRTKFVKQ